jgi:hypothetical protein
MKKPIALRTNAQRKKFIRPLLRVPPPTQQGPIEQLLTKCFTKLNLPVTLIKDSQTTF